MSKIVGTVGKSLENVFQNELIQSYIPNASATGGSSRQKIKKFVEEYHNEGLFEDRGERSHSGFENLSITVNCTYTNKIINMHSNLKLVFWNLHLN